MTASVLYRWPASAYFGRVVPKNKFYEQGKVAASVREKFVAEVQRITWAYKLADSTIHLRSSDAVPEIQVFALDAKGDDVSDAVLTAIDKTVQFPIIFEVNRNDADNPCTRMVLTPKELRSATPQLTSYFSTEWMLSDSSRSPLPAALDLPGLYAALIAPLLPVAARPGERLADTRERLGEARKLERELATLERRLRNEPQFNRKVELRRQLNDRIGALDALTNPTQSDTDDAVGKEAKWTS
jgi:hypothetical protein